MQVYNQRSDVAPTTGRSCARVDMEVSVARVMGTSARLGVLAVLAALSLAIGMRLGSWAFRRPAPLLGATAASEALLGGNSYLSSVGGQSSSDPLDTMREVVEMTQSEYVDKVDNDGKLAAGAVRTLLYTLDDPRTRYWTEEQLKLLDQQMDGVYSGIGAVIAIVKETRNEVEQRRVSVIAPVPGGPSDRAGVRAGDYITGIDGRWVIAYDPRLDLNRLALRTMPDKEYRQIIKDASKKLQDGMSWPRALEQLTQPKGKDLELTIERAGAPAPIKVKVTREEKKAEPVEYRPLGSAIGYLRVTQFTPSAPKDAVAALKAAPVSKLIVDLRDNAGGPDRSGARSVVASATGVLAALGVTGDVGTIAKGAKRTPITVTTANATHLPAKRAMAVLVNKGSANIAEIVAAALRTRGGASLIGSQTHGDSGYQKLVKLSQGAMTLSAGTYRMADGKPIPATGIKPTVAVATGGPRVDKDPAVAKALAVLGKMDGGRP